VSESKPGPGSITDVQGVRVGRYTASRAGDPAGEGGSTGGCPRNPPVSTLTGGAIPTLNSRPADNVETTSGETVPDSEFSD